MAIETTALNSALIAAQVQQLLTNPLQQASSFLASGPVMLDSNSPVRLPRVAASAAGFVAEGQQIPDSNIPFDEVTALSSSLRSIKTWLPVSNELIRGAAVNGLSQVLETRLVTDVANKLDRALYGGKNAGANAVQTVTLTGSPTGGTFTLSYGGQTTSGIAFDATTSTVQTAFTGLSTVGSGNATVSGSAGAYVVTFASALAARNVLDIIANGSSLTGGTVPSVAVTTTVFGTESGGIQGLVNQAGVQVAPLSTASPDCLLDAIALAQAANAQPNRLFLNPVDFIALRKLRATSTDGRYLIDPDVHTGTQFSLFGIPVTVTNHLPQGQAILADMRYVVVVRDTGASVFIADQTLAASDAIAIRCTLRMDLAVTQPRAVVVLKAS